MKRLIACKASVDMTPPGSGVAAVIGVLTDPGALQKIMRAAAGWADAAVQTLREAADPNPWRTATDEEIAGELLRAIEERKRTQAKAGCPS